MLSLATQSAAVFEVWTTNQHGSALEHGGGSYGELESFRLLSEETHFTNGDGIPGMVWKSGQPHIIENLGTSPQFWRASDARRDGLYTGIGLPVMTGNGMQVVLLLSSKDAPLFKACEIWKPNDDGSALQLAESAYGDAHDLRPACAGVPIAAAEGIAGQILLSQSPLVTDDLADVEPLRAHKAIDSGITTGIGYPIFRDDMLSAVVVMFC